MEKVFEALFELPLGIKASVEKNVLVMTSTGNGKSQSRAFNAREMTVSVQENKIVARAKNAKKSAVSLINAFVSHVKNMCFGLQNSFEYRLEIVYSHFPITVVQKEKMIEILNVGGSKKHRNAKILGDTVVQVKGKEIIASGSNKEHVGQTAANIEQNSRIKGKDARVFQDGIYIVQKHSKKIG